ncbi:MAG: tRNA dihydrouridine synthase DusB [Bacteroidetes bacterium]|nr:tRNA dihydrouridine synthase DusB [Bacteroidota bacterium]
MVTIGNISLPEFPLLLAPMEDVSDPPFRAVCKANGADLTYTEFISTQSLVKGAIKAQRKLDIFEAERPVGIQLYGGDEESMELAAAIVDTTNPDLLDINFGCPVKGVVHKGAGAGVLKDLDRMVRLTEACVRATRLPVTVKTRLGWDEDSKNIEEVAMRLQDVGIQALTIHGRTRCQLYKGEADWTLIGKVKNNPRIKIPIFGNGDINSPQKAKEYKDRYGIDGIMVGRAAIGYPWIFREIRHYIETGEVLTGPSIKERVAVCRQHLSGALSWNGPVQGLNEMRGRYGHYLKGLPGIQEYQRRLVRLSSPEAVEELLSGIENEYQGFVPTTSTIRLVDYHANCTL